MSCEGTVLPRHGPVLSTIPVAPPLPSCPSKPVAMAIWCRWWELNMVVVLVDVSDDRHDLPDPAQDVWGALPTELHRHGSLSGYEYGCGSRIRTCDVLGMSQVSYHCSTPQNYGTGIRDLRPADVFRCRGLPGQAGANCAAFYQKDPCVLHRPFGLVVAAHRSLIPDFL